MEPQDDLDREKVRIFWDYNKTRIYTSLTMMISVFVAIVVILNAINLNGKVPFQLVWAIGFTLTILFLPYILITGVLVKEKKLIIETDALMQKLAKHEPIQPLKELLKVDEPTAFWEEYKKLFGISRNRIIAITILLLVLLILGYFGI